MTSFVPTFVASMPRTTGIRRHKTVLHGSRKWRMLHRPSTVNARPMRRPRTRTSSGGKRDQLKRQMHLCVLRKAAPLWPEIHPALQTTVVSGILSSAVYYVHTVKSLSLPRASRTTLSDAPRSRRGHWKWIWPASQQQLRNTV